MHPRNQNITSYGIPQVMPQEAVCGGCHHPSLVHTRGDGCHQGAALCGERIEPMYQPRRPVVDTRVQQHAGAADGEAEREEEEMKKELYEYLIAELYPLPECRNCKYADVSPGRLPCRACKCREGYKLDRRLEQDVKNLVKGIIKIVKEHEGKK